MWYFVLTIGIWVQTTIVMFLMLLVTVNISCWLLCSRVEGHTSAELLGAFPTKSATVSFLRFARHNLLLAAGAIQWLWAKQLQFWQTFARWESQYGYCQYCCLQITWSKHPLPCDKVFVSLSLLVHWSPHLYGYCAPELWLLISQSAHED